MSNLFEIPKHPFTNQAKKESSIVTVRGKLVRDNETHNFTFHQEDLMLIPIYIQRSRITGKTGKVGIRIAIFTP